MTVDVYNYYDGYLAGVYETDDGEKFYFLHDGKDFYPEKMPPGRTYHTWRIEEWPDDTTSEEWWKNGGPRTELWLPGDSPRPEPDGTITEAELMAFNAVPFEAPDLTDEEEAELLARPE